MVTQGHRRGIPNRVDRAPDSPIEAGSRYSAWPGGDAFPENQTERPRVRQIGRKAGKNRPSMIRFAAPELSRPIRGEPPMPEAGILALPVDVLKGHTRGHGATPSLRSALKTVLAEHSKSEAILRRLAPPSRIRRIAASCPGPTFRGGPRVFPCWRARSSPSRVRRLMDSSSWSATQAANMVKIWPKKASGLPSSASRYLVHWASA